ncbi:bifunctional 4-hydroxy-2-oxoglutarate aldolase/2-dehydro-3-deoxy-phosphogluconate aldolase [soil metagenome]
MTDRPLFADETATRVSECGVIAVLVIDSASDAVPLARALLAGGVAAMELTLRTPAAVDAIRAIAAEVPEMLVGAGTVLTAAQVDEVQSAGAAFAVSPGVNPRVLAAARDAGLSFAPGIVTPSDIEAALEFGCRLLKFFPAESSGGLKHLKNIAAPYKHLGLRYIPLGGINAANMGGYLGDPGVAAIGGSWLAEPAVVARGDWAGIREAAAHAVGLAKAARR